MKYKELTIEIINECIKELRTHKKSDYVNKTESLTGRTGLLYCCLGEMYFHGRFMYPTTYKYRYELAKYVEDHIKNDLKQFKKKISY